MAVSSLVIFFFAQLRVLQGKDLGDGNTGGAAVHAVAAGSAGDFMLCLIKGTHLANDFVLLSRQGFEICHVGEIVLQLLHIAHAGQNHDDVFKTGGIADGIAGGASLCQQFQRCLGKVDQCAALDWLHDKYGLAVLAANFVTQAALHIGIIVVRIVKLQLDEFQLGAVSQNLIQYFGTVMEGHTHMAQLAFGFQLLSNVIGLCFGEHTVTVGAQGMHQIKIKIFHTAGLQLIFHQTADAFTVFEADGGKLVCQKEPAAVITVRKAGLDHFFAETLVIGTGGVEVIKSGIEKRVYHGAERIGIDLITLLGQAHTAKAKIFLDFGEKTIHSSTSSIPFCLS